MNEVSTFSTLLRDWRAGDEAAGEEFLQQIYQELHRLAQHYLQREQYAHSLSPTVLIHETYLRLFGNAEIPFTSRTHFFVIAAQQMRRLLVDRARRATAQKRIRAGDLAPLTEAAALSQSGDLELLALDEALTRFAAFDPRAAQVVVLRYFGGYEEAEVAQLLAVSPATVRRDWQAARRWLYLQLQGQELPPI